MAEYELTGPGGRAYTFTGPDGATPDQVQQKAAQLKQSIATDPHGTAEKMYGLPSGALKSLQSQESGGKADAESGTGARGLMQFTHKTGAQYGITDENWRDPLTQIDAAGQYLRDLTAQNKGNFREALKHYYGVGQHRPGDPTPDQYADSVLSRMPVSSQPTPAGHILGVSEAAAATQPPAAAKVAPPAEGGALAQAGRRALVQWFIKPAAHANAVLNRWGAGTITPAEFNAYYAGLGFDPTSLPTAAASSGVGQALELAEPLKALTPGIGVAGAATAALSNHDLADGVEAAIGGVQAARAGIGLAMKAPEAARKAYNALRGLRRMAAISELGAETATAANRAATAEALASETTGPVTATAHLRETLGVPQPVATPDEAAALAGRTLAATARHRMELLPGEDVGVHGIGARIGSQVRQKFGKAEALAHGMPLDPADGDVLNLQRGAAALAGEKGLAPAERELVDQLQHLGGGHITTEPGPIKIGGRALNPKGTPEEQQLYAQITATPEGREAVEASRVAAVKRHPTAPTDLSGAMKLYGSLRRAAITPSEYPLLGARGPTRNAVYKLSNELGDLIRSRTVATPGAFEAWDDATRYVLEEQVPMRAIERAVTGAAKSGATPTKTLGVLMGSDSEPFERVIRNVSASQRELYQRGAAMSLLRMKGVTGADGKIAGTALKTRLNNLPLRTQQIIAAVQPEAAAALNDVIAGKQTWGEAAPTLNKAVSKIHEAIDALITEQKAAARAPKAAQVGRDAARGGMATFARYHAIRALFSLATGHGTSAAYQGGTWLLMRHPDLFMSLIRSDKATPDQLRVLAGGLTAALAPLQQQAPQRQSAFPSAALSALR